MRKRDRALMMNQDSGSTLPTEGQTSSGRSTPDVLAAHSFRQHASLNFSMGYGFFPTEQQMIRFLKLFHESKSVPACPVHFILDFYALSPTQLAGNYQRGSPNDWFFLAVKKYDPSTKQPVRVHGSDEQPGYWKKKGRNQKINAGSLTGDRVSLEHYFGELGGGSKTIWEGREYLLSEDKSKQGPIYILMRLSCKSNTEESVQEMTENPPNHSASNLCSTPHGNTGAGEVFPTQIPHGGSRQYSNFWSTPHGNTGAGEVFPTQIPHGGSRQYSNLGSTPHGNTGAGEVFPTQIPYEGLGQLSNEADEQIDVTALLENGNDGTGESEIGDKTFPGVK